MRAPSATDLAAVRTPNPDHPYTWAKSFGLLAVMFGFVIALVGMYAVRSTWRSLDPQRRRKHLVPLTVTAGVFLAVGLAVAAFGVWLF
ncbi:hypothetical protein N8I84_17990 [Streptomyces cynarae]|uniref:Uncharacterized protein n=1 Tax=Streptomyces cynarae TaxID=2981134 RepID=A0ABY6E154_9ACTN|nr:hypothetical protein [Streptomyces cynarae]UXY20397.1 hypothetical protein N8I84_17990 [Streptomyces cynarae]